MSDAMERAEEILRGLELARLECLARRANDRGRRESIEGAKGHRVLDSVEVYRRDDGHGWSRKVKSTSYEGEVYKAMILERYVTVNSYWRNSAYLVRILEGPYEGKEIRVQ